MTRSHPDNTVGEALSAWLDGELDEAEAAEIEAELARDPALRADLEELEGVVRLLREEGPSEAPMNFHARVMARIEEEHPAEGWSLTRWLGVRWEALAIGFAAVAALALLVPMSWQGPAPTEGPSEDGATAPGVARPAPERANGVSGQDARADRADATVGERKLEATPQPQVIGRATTGGADPTAPTTATGAPIAGSPERVAGTSEEAPPATDGVPLPEVAVDAGIAGDEQAWRTTIRSDDAAMKRKVLSVGARYGTVTDTAGVTVTSAAMTSSREQLVVTLPQAQLASFQQELRGLGLEVESHAPSELTAAGAIEVRVTLQLTSSGGTASEPEPSDPAASRKAYDLEDVGR